MLILFFFIQFMMYLNNIQIFNNYVRGKLSFQNYIRSVISQRICRRNCSSSPIKSAWKSVVGLEIHAQINSKSKLFSNSASLFKAPTNTQVTYYDAALPGCLPVLNKCCVEAGVLTALALNCDINKKSMFDRKHYFYPDLPAGYQITQQFYPLASNGYLKFHVYETVERSKSYECHAHLKQLQLEQDSGRSFHIEGHGSLVDLNRAGIGLMELVFEPDLKNGSEAAALVEELILILRCIGVCTCDMEEGALRVDANISVNRIGEPLGVRTEVKNINSLRHISKAIDYEIDRQIKIIEDGGYVLNETRAFDYNSKKTIYLRDKETLQDYRFMPEPNLPPIILYDDKEVAVNDEDSDVINIDRLREKLPVFPAAERLRLISEYGISYDIADRLVSYKGLKELFEHIAPHVINKNVVVRYLFYNVKHQLNQRKLSYQDCPVTSEQIGDIIKLLEKNVISEATSNDILEMFFNGDQRPAADIVKEYNWYQINHGDELVKLCLKTMRYRSKVVKKYRNSRKKIYMRSLMAGLTAINNRVSIKDAEETFIKLICKDDNHEDKNINKNEPDSDDESQ